MAHQENTGLPRLAPLHDLKDFKVANNNLDVRGWEVVGSDGKRIGKVDDLIVDRELMKVRYLDVDVDQEHVLVDTDPRHILIPIGAAQLDDDSDQVFVSMDQRSLARFPFYRGGAVDSEYEYRVMHAVTSPNDTYTQQSNTAAAPNDEFYGRDHFNEDRFYGSRSYRQQQSPTHHESPMHHDTSRHQEPPMHQHQENSHSHIPHVPHTSHSGNQPITGGGHQPIQDDIATIERLRSMLEQGTITQEEFAILKRKAIGF